MTFKEIEFIFNRALQLSFSKKKFLLMFPILVASGLLLVFCRALAVHAGQWIVLSLTFLPIFLSSGLLLSAGVVLARIYRREVQLMPPNFKKVLSESWELLIGVSYVTFPVLLAYLFLWMVMGLFYLLKEIPTLGDVLGVVLSFAPFLLVLGSLVLSFLSVALLFFATPHIALSSRLKLKVVEEILICFKANLFSNLILFFVGLLPLLAGVALLSVAAFLTGLSFFMGAETLAIALQWFFIMIPFSALLTPGVLFFFNFSVESYGLMQKKWPIKSV